MDNNLINRHLDWLRRKTNSADTYRHRRDNLRRLAAALDPIPLGEVTYSDLDKWQSSLKLSAQSVYTYTCHARAFYGWLHETGLRSDDPSTKLPLPKLSRRLPRPIPEKHLELAFRHADQTMGIWLALAGWCGLRAGEIARLRGDSVIEDADERMLLRIDGKGGKERIIPVPLPVVEIFRPVVRPGPLFHRPSGLPATPNFVSVEAGSYFRQLGLPYVLHQCRHRFGTEHYRLCKDIRQTQELMGHSSPSTTAGYIAVSQTISARSMDRLGKSLPKRRRQE